MKKLFIVALGTFLFTTAKSQVYIQGGLNLANISTTNSGSVNKNNTLATFNAGFLARSISTGIAAIESGLLVEGRGAKVEGVLEILLIKLHLTHCTLNFR